MGKRLLLADDSITIQKVVAIIFSDEQYELTVVGNGTEAVGKAKETHPDVMLVDAVMPGMDGYQVCEEIRRDPELKSTPLLLMVGAFEPFDEERGRACGADATITKPFESQQLIDKVKELLTLGEEREAAAVSAPPPVEAGGEELWGDLSSFDTLPPVTPAASKPAAAAAAPPTVEEEILEATLEDDLWGAFELEEEEIATVAAAEAIELSEAESEFEVEQEFSFEEAEGIQETGPALEPLELAEDPLLRPEPVGDFAFPQTSLEELQQESFAPSDVAPFSFEPEAAAEAPITEFPAEPIDLETPVEEEPVAMEPPFEPEPIPSARTFTVTEAELTAAISRISKEVIERVVWEVVPDLAEMLIKEEIRKLKAGIKG